MLSRSACLLRGVRHFNSLFKLPVCLCSSVCTTKNSVLIVDSVGATSTFATQQRTLSSSNANRDVAALKLTKITNDDFDAVMELLMDDFIRNEPLSNSLNLEREESQWLFKELALSTIGTSVSYAFRAPDGTLAAARLCNIMERPSNNEHGLFAVLETQGAQQAQTKDNKSLEVIRIVNELESKTWGLVGAEMKRLLNVVILSCHRNWTRRGLVSKLLECDLDEQKKMGIDGAISEATAYNSQRLFAKYGYVPIYEIKHDAWLDKNGRRIFKCRDKTVSAQLVFKKY